MARRQPSSLRRIAVLASGALLLLGAPVLAQPVAVFDEAPSIEQLRSIMLPESRPGLSRSIVIQMPETAPADAPVQRASTEAPPAPRKAARRAPPPVQQAAAGMPAPQSDAAGEAVAFHVNFGFNSAALPDTAQAMIGLIVQLMKETPAIKLRVEGHTDAVGAVAYNLALSERRALSVGEAIAGQGVEPGRMELVGKGMSEPLMRNKYDPANRRVQFVRID